MDPVNCTLSEYKAFAANRIELMNGSRINERNFDQLMELILNQEEGDSVVDSGASTFVPLSDYLVENRAVEMLFEAGKEVIVHPVVTGGQALFDTLNGLDSLATQFSKGAGIIVWLNEYFGDIVHDNKPFESMKIYQKHPERLNGIVRIPRQNPDTFGRDEILQAYSAQITRSLEKVRDEIEAISHRVHEDSKAVATRIVGTAVSSGIAEIQEATKSFTEHISAWCERERTLQVRRYQTVLVCAGASLTIRFVAVILHVIRW